MGNRWKNHGKLYWKHWNILQHVGKLWENIWNSSKIKWESHDISKGELLDDVFKQLTSNIFQVSNPLVQLEHSLRSCAAEISIQLRQHRSAWYILPPISEINFSVYICPAVYPAQLFGSKSRTSRTAEVSSINDQSI